MGDLTAMAADNSAGLHVASELDARLRWRLRIEAMFADYAHCIDEDRLEEWPACFVEHGRYRVTTRENVELGLPLSLIRCEGRGMLTDRIVAMRTANIFEPHVYCHMVGALRLLDTAGGEIKVQSNFIVVRTMADGTMTVFACGKYLDTIVEEGGTLLFRERTVMLDSRSIDTLLVIPL
jgi:anthranilate 1,2-dioxygenase small subunit